MSYQTTLRANSYLALLGITLTAVFFFMLIGLVFFFVYGSLLCLVMAMLMAVVMLVVQWGISTSVVEWSTKIQYLRPGENKFLEKHVGRLCEKADVPTPKLGIVNNPAPNAFVFGRTRSDMRMGVHTGLLEQLNKQEIIAVLAHEVGHIKHGDATTMTIISVLPTLAYWGAMMIWFGGGRSREGGAIIAFAIISAIVYVVSTLLILRLSRIREYASDAYSAELTGNPRSLASGLVKITYGLSLAPPDKSSGARSFYIADQVSAAAEMKDIKKRNRKNRWDLDEDGLMDERELEKAMEQRGKRGGMSEILGTHPPTHKRIRALMNMEKEMREGELKE